MQLTGRDKYHLQSRAEFFVHTSELIRTSDGTKAVEELFKKQQVKPLIMDLTPFNLQEFKRKPERERKELKDQWKKQVVELNHNWVKQMGEKDKGLVEKMTLFWHGHFACRTRENPYTTLELNNLLRINALGNFRTLLYGVSKSAGMIAYLHLKQNRKGKPNEDFARELCELFTLGRDVGYTELDVTEIARAFTGWVTDGEGKFQFLEKRHDNSEKTIFGKTGSFTGQDVLEMILEKRECAVHIARKVFTFFVAEELINEYVEELADVLYKSDYDITQMMKHLFNAEWFYQSHGKIIKSPIELLVGLSKMFNLNYKDQRTVIGIQQYLGQVLFDPPNVAGWAGGRQWIDASRLGLRLRLGALILNKGYIMDELSPELDAVISKGIKKRDLKFYEEIDWELFWEKNRGASFFDLLIRSENENLKQAYDQPNIKSILRLISTPDFQLT